MSSGMRYRVRRGDSWCIITKLALGSGERWQELRDLNQHRTLLIDLYTAPPWGKWIELPAGWYIAPHLAAY